MKKTFCLLVMLLLSVTLAAHAEGAGIYGGTAIQIDGAEVTAYLAHQGNQYALSVTSYGETRVMSIEYAWGLETQDVRVSFDMNGIVYSARLDNGEVRDVITEAATDPLQEDQEDGWPESSGDFYEEAELFDFSLFDMEAMQGGWFYSEEVTDPVLYVDGSWVTMTEHMTLPEMANFLLTPADEDDPRVTQSSSEDSTRQTVQVEGNTLIYRMEMNVGGEWVVNTFFVTRNENSYILRMVSDGEEIIQMELVRIL